MAGYDQVTVSWPEPLAPRSAGHPSGWRADSTHTLCLYPRRRVTVTAACPGARAEPCTRRRAGNRRGGRLPTGSVGRRGRLPRRRCRHWRLADGDPAGPTALSRCSGLARDQHGNVSDVLVQSRRNAKAARRFLRKLLKGLRYVPRVLVTDKLASYGVAHRELMPSVTHRQSRYLNNRAENSHQPTRQRERALRRFKSVRHAQQFLSAFSGISTHFRPRRYRLSATGWRTEMAERFAIWDEVIALDTAA
jgi:putative transposase